MDCHYWVNDDGPVDVVMTPVVAGQRYKFTSLPLALGDKFAYRFTYQNHSAMTYTEWVVVTVASFGPYTGATATDSRVDRTETTSDFGSDFPRPTPHALGGGQLITDTESIDAVCLYSK